MNFAVKTVSFSRLFANDVIAQVHISTGLPSITIVGLASKSVAESKERVKAALSNMVWPYHQSEYQLNYLRQEWLKKALILICQLHLQL